jgi:hypothetical protein
MRASKLPFLFGLTLAFGCGGGSEPPTEYPDALAADPDHYTVEFENDAVRLLRIDYGPGETSVMHSHPASCAIFLGDQAVTFELPGGEVEDAPAGGVGVVNCVDAGVHRPTNTGTGDLQVVLVEFKGRATVQG